MGGQKGGGSELNSLALSFACWEREKVWLFLTGVCLTNEYDAPF